MVESTLPSEERPEDNVTQKQRILQWLQENPNGVCATDLLRVRIPRGAARISDLRADGYEIDTVTCFEHGHQTRQIRYVLRREPVQLTTETIR